MRWKTCAAALPLQKELVRVCFFLLPVKSWRRAPRSFRLNPERRDFPFFVFLCFFLVGFYADIHRIRRRNWWAGEAKQKKGQTRTATSNALPRNSERKTKKNLEDQFGLATRNKFCLVFFCRCFLKNRHEGRRCCPGTEAVDILRTDSRHVPSVYLCSRAENASETVMEIPEIAPARCRSTSTPTRLVLLWSARNMAAITGDAGSLSRLKRNVEESDQSKDAARTPFVSLSLSLYLCVRSSSPSQKTQFLTDALGKPCRTRQLQIPWDAASDFFSLSLSLRQMRSGWRKTTFSSTFQCAAEDLQSQLHPTGGLLWFRIRKKEQKKVPNPADTRKLKVAASVRRPMAQFLTSSRKRVSQFWKLGLKNERAYEVNTRLNSATKSDSFSDAKSFHY